MGLFNFGKEQHISNRTISLADNRRLYIGQPAEYPSEMVDRIVNQLKTESGVGKALLAQLYIEHDKFKPHPLIAIQMTNNSNKDFNRVQSDIAVAVKGATIPGGIVDFLELGETADLTAPLFKNFKVIYDKNIG